MSIKYIITLLIALFSSCRTGLGVYSTLPNLGGKSYELLDNNRFKGGEWSCMYSQTGYGNYYIKNKILTFTYDTIRNHEYYDLRKKAENSEFLKLDIFLLDSASMLPFHSIYTIYKSDKEVDKGKFNESGRAVIEILKNQEIWLMVDGPNHIKSFIPLPENGVYELTIILGEYLSEDIFGLPPIVADSEEFKVVKYSRNRLTLKNHDGNKLKLINSKNRLQ